MINKTEKALCQNEKSWHLLIMNSPDHILILDLEGIIKFVNRVVSGFKKENIINKSIYDLVPSHFVNSIKNCLKKVKKTGKTVLYETEFVLPNGQISWYEARVARIIENDKIVGFTVNCSDITDRREKDEELLLQSQISMNISEGINLIKADNGLIVFTNPTFDKMFGYEPGELIGKHISIVNAPIKNKSPEKAALEIMNFLLNNDIWRGEISNIKKDGTIFWCFASISLFNHPKYGKVLVSVQRDITESKKIEKELKESEERFRQVAEVADEWIWEVDTEGLFTYSSPNIINVLGYKPEEVIGKKYFYDLFTSEAKTKIKKEAFQIFYEKKALRNFENENKHKNGNTIIIETSGLPIIDENGNFSGYRGADINITHRKKIEEQLNRSLSVLRSTLESTADGILVVDTEGKWISFNKKFIEMWNITKNVIAIADDGKAVNSVLSQLKYPDIFIKKVKYLYNNPEDKSFDIIEMNDGRIFERYSQPQYDKEHIAGRVWSFRDTTKQKQAEFELKKSHERLRELTMHMQEVIENERKKIALDLHDDLGQMLTALSMDLSWLKTKILKDLPYLSDKLNEMTGLLNLALKNVQKIATELRPSILDDLGLISAVEWLLKEYKRKSNIEYQLNESVKGLILKQTLSVAIFRIIQEALTNVARHANATFVKVSILKESKLLKVIIEDNGKGITKSNIDDSKSFGLMGIKERANVFNGKVNIIGEANKGTKLIVKIPYE